MSKKPEATLIQAIKEIHNTNWRILQKAITLMRHGPKWTAETCLLFAIKHEGPPMINGHPVRVAGRAIFETFTEMLGENAMSTDPKVLEDLVKELFVTSENDNKGG